MKWLIISNEVQAALNKKRPIVALESTIITHGLPHPQNLETALAVEAIIRDEGATPATIAVIEGKIHIGLSSRELEWLATAKVKKISRRDLPIVLSQRESGATTVASTMIAAELAKIPLFVTGGIGGVHRDVAETWDISADLQEFSTTDVAVVTAGAKSILDIPKTLEVLETLGVPVLGYQTQSFPAFYCRDSGCPVDATIKTAYDAASIIQTKKALGLKGGVIIANPIPEEFALAPSNVETWIEEAMQMAKEKRITGKDITPYLLAALIKKSQGKTLEANVALIQNNARLGAEIAVELARL